MTEGFQDRDCGRPSNAWAPLDGVEAGLAVLDDRQRVVAWNAWLERASGVAAHDAIERTLPEIFPNRPLDEVVRAAAAALESGASRLLTHRLHGDILPLRSRTGHRLVHDFTVHALRAPPAHCLLQVLDVTAAVHREAVLRDRLNARYEALVGSSSDAILTIDSEGVVVRANPATQVFGRDVGQIIGRPIMSIFAQPDWESAWLAVLTAEAPPPPFELTAVRADGEWLHLEVSTSGWESGAHRYVTATCRDIGVRKSHEAALGTLNESLRREVAERSADIERLNRLQAAQALMVDELQHRTRNLIAVVGSLATQTLAVSADLPDFAAGFMARLSALSRIQGLLSRAQSEPITIRALVGLELEALAGEGKATLTGPHVQLQTAAVQTLALVLHELATNARKHGALSPTGGTLEVNWQVAPGVPEQLHLTWTERFREPLGSSPERRGYGRELIEEALPYSLGARTRFELAREGLHCEIVLGL